MITYDNGGIKEYNSSQNYGTRIFASTKVINGSYTPGEVIRFNFATGADVTLEVTWYEFNLYNDGTTWTWWGDQGWYVNTSGTVSGRFGNTRYQTGTNNGVGTWTISGSSVYWSGYSAGPSQNICSLYVVATSNRWDKITQTYPTASTTTTTTSTSSSTTTSTTTTAGTTTTTTSTTTAAPGTTTTTTSTTSAPLYKYYFQLVDLTNPPNLGGGTMTLNATGGSAVFTTDYNLSIGSSTYGISGSNVVASSGKRIQKIDKIAYDGTTVLATQNIAATSYTFGTGTFDMTSLGNGAGQFQTIKVYMEASPTTTTTTTSTSTTTTTTSTSTTTSTTTLANVTVSFTFQLDASNAGSMAIYTASPAGAAWVLSTTLTTNGATANIGLLAGDAYYVTVTQTARANTSQRGQIQNTVNGTATTYTTSAGALPQSISSPGTTLSAGSTYSVLGLCGTPI